MTTQKSKPGASDRTTKIAEVIALLQCSEGATLEDITSATKWLPHSARAALAGLKKKGHVIEKCKRNGVRCYRIIGPS